VVHAIESAIYTTPFIF